jgi:CheY-like chemotaxis protein
VSEVRLPERRLFTGFIRDLSEQKRLEREFLHAQKMEAVGSLSGGIAHDFNNLLMGILGCARLAGSELEPGNPARRMFEEIAGAAKRGIALTRRLLAFSRRQPVELRPTSIDTVVRDNETMLRQLLGEEIVLRIELSASGGSVRADEGLVEQVLINLLVNARDAMPRGGEIGVATWEQGQEVVVQVRDTGCGIPPELQARIFEPFFSTKGPDQGTGLGLSTVKRIVEQMGGRIELESEVGLGSAFRLAFPSCQATPELRVESIVPAAARRRPRRVLLVEDDRLVRASLGRFLEGLGHGVVSAGSPGEALDLAAGMDAVDVLVTDVVLPHGTGRELARQLSAKVGALQVIFMSAIPHEVLVEQGRLDPGVFFLEKPFEMEDLEQMLGQVPVS